MNTDWYTTRQRAHVGARLLDDRKPDWFMTIDLDTLDMSNVQSCVLGQMYGSFETGSLHLFNDLNWDTAAEFGFHTRYWSDSPISANKIWDNLRAAWVDEIQRRSA